MNEPVDIESAIADADSEFPALYQLFGGYFHEDWRAEYAQPSDAVGAFKREAPPEAVHETERELERLLSTGFDETALARLLEAGFGCNYVPSRDGTTIAAWLESVREELRVSVLR